MDPEPLLPKRKSLTEEEDETAPLLTKSFPRLFRRHASTSSRSTTNLLWLNKPKIIFVDFFHWCLDVTWWKLFLGFTVAFVLINWFFAWLYWLGGPGTLHGPKEPLPDSPFLDYFSFSIQTIFTIGYGHVFPATWYANVLVLVESWLGLFINAFLIVITHSKFSRPSRAKRMIIFSDKACVVFRRESVEKRKKTRAKDDNDIQGNWYIMFRFVNIRKAQLVNTRFHLIMLQWKDCKSPNMLQCANSERTQTNKDPENPGPHLSLHKGYQQMETGKSLQPYLSSDSEDIEGYDDILEPRQEDLQLESRGSIVPNARRLTRNIFRIGTDSKKFIVPKMFELDFELNAQTSRAKKLAFSVPLLPLPWMCSHKIDYQSPLYPYLQQSLKELKRETEHGVRETGDSKSRTLSLPNIEIVAVLDGCDEATSDNLQARFSYSQDDILIDYDFAPIMSANQARFILDYEEFHKVLPTTTRADFHSTG